MNFATLRLGKTSVEDIRKLDALNEGAQNPAYFFETTCTQVPSTVQPGTYVFIWLGSDNPKGGGTEWVQGFRAIGRVISVVGEEYRGDFTLGVSVGYVFNHSVTRKDLLREASDAYYWCCEAPIIGLDDRANQTVRIIENEELSSVSAILYGFGVCEPTLRTQLPSLYPELAPFLNYAPSNPRVVSHAKSTTSFITEQTGPKNLIYFGAPGTGKSYQLDQQAHAFATPDSHGQSRSARVTFHPRYSYFSFVGSYKPLTRGEGEPGAGDIYYAFVPGPFTSMLVKALNNPDEDYLLILEEINRADTASVFGDIFQLLDRTQHGHSTYPVAAHEELATFLRAELSSVGQARLAELGGQCGADVQIVIPANLNIWATMNSADQGVFPLDSAFKRRWDFAYVGINDGQEMCSWNDERLELNELLKSNAKVNEDKLIGPFFLSNAVKPRNTDGSITQGFSDIFANKVLMYLVEDAAKYTMRSLVRPDLVPESATLSDYLQAWRAHNFGMFSGCESWTASLSHVESSLMSNRDKDSEVVRSPSTVNAGFPS